MTLPYHTPLSHDQQRAAGLSQPWPLAMADRVRYAELDPLNHANNAVYIVWFESIRLAYYRSCGLFHDDAVNPRTVVRRAEIEYLAEMRMDEDYIVTARTRAFRNTSFTMDSELWAGGTLRATYSAVIVLLPPEGPGRLPIPDAVRRHFETVDGAIPDTA